MNDRQWSQLLQVLKGEQLSPRPAGFIIDSPWLPNWAGMSILDYFASEQLWLEANLKAVRRFPDVMMLPGFWPEFGMCTEPSAFGAVCVWHENELPFADKILETPEQMKALRKPNPRTDGLLPLVLKRAVHCRPAIEQEGHAFRFACARGPLNIGSFLMGTTEFLMAIKESPDEMHAMLTTITGFLVDWLRLQKETMPTIDGIFMLDDLTGFLNAADFQEFAAPYLKKAFGAFPASVRFFHNDAHGLKCAPLLKDIGINLFNHSFQHSLTELRKLCGDGVTLLGNIPPRDVLAGGTADGVRQAVKEMLAPLPDHRYILFSGGGGMAPHTSTENIEAFMAALRGT